MVRIMGNSLERVFIKDLNDVIYYKQVKEYTDQEFEKSWDLKEALRSGKIVQIEKTENLRGSVNSPEQYKVETSINILDLKAAIREVLPELKDNQVSGNDLKTAVRDIAPLIVDMVRQEVSRMSFNGGVQQEQKKVFYEFQGPEYIPTINTDGMKSNIETKKTEVSGNDVSDNLAALRRLKK